MRHVSLRELNLPLAFLSVFFCIALVGCGEAAQQYSVKKHVRFCEEMADSDPKYAGPFDAYIENCMKNVKGHTGFSMDEFRAQQKLEAQRKQSQ